MQHRKHGTEVNALRVEVAVGSYELVFNFRRSTGQIKFEGSVNHAKQIDDGSSVPDDVMEEGRRAVIAMLAAGRREPQREDRRQRQLL
jgi:hypothetical protein